MTTLHIDCTFGIAGDMLLAALIDLGADQAFIDQELRRLPIDDFRLSSERVDRCGISARRLSIQLDGDPSPHHQPPHGDHHHGHGHHDHDHHQGGAAHHHPHRPAGEILDMLAQSALPDRVRTRATALFTAIAEAEGRIHGIDPRDVHLHEVGAMDSIIDIIGVCLALENLGVDHITACPVPVGHGVVSMAHGRFPIPAPAALELLKGVPLSDFDAPGELTTPTGAAFLGVLVSRFGALPAQTPTRIGYGAGHRNPAHPNVLRTVLFDHATDAPAGHDNDQTSTREQITVLSCQVDDATGEQLGHALTLLMDAGALDVFHTPVTMKKSRPGVLVTVLARMEDADRLEGLLLIHTPTFGVRRQTCQRRILERHIETLTTPLGEVRIKVGLLEGTVLRQTPEYEDVRRLALAHDLSLSQTLEHVQAALRASD